MVAMFKQAHVLNVRFLCNFDEALTLYDRTR